MESITWEGTKELFSDVIEYLVAVGWRTVAIWFALSASLYSWEPYRAVTPLSLFYLPSYIAEDARKHIIWLIALALAQVWIGITHVVLKDNKHMLFIIIAITSFVSIGLVQDTASKQIEAVYGSPSYMRTVYDAHYGFYIGVGILLLVPCFIWRKRDLHTQI